MNSRATIRLRPAASKRRSPNSTRPSWKEEARHRSGPSRRSRHDGRSLDAHARRRVGHIGLYRDENKRPVEYFVRLPDTEGRNFIVVDPMLATGYSGAYAVDTLKKRGIPGSQIQFMALVAAPEGVKTFTELHPDVESTSRRLTITSTKTLHRPGSRRRGRSHLRHEVSPVPSPFPEADAEPGLDVRFFTYIRVY